MDTQYRPDEKRSIAEESADSFGHRDYARALFAAIADVPPRFTLGLFGPWGSGKSTILDEVGRLFREENARAVQGAGAPEGRTAFVVFDAWRYEDDSLRREFIRDIGGSLEREEFLKKGFVDRHTEQFDTDTVVQRAEMRTEWRAIPRAVVLAVLALVAFFLAASVLPVLGAQDETVLKVLVAMSGAIAVFVLTGFSGVLVVSPVQKAQKRFEFPDQFAKSFRELVREVDADRLVIGIDNLDRCAPARVAEMLATIKTFLEPEIEPGKRLVSIVAADDEALKRHLLAQEMASSGASEISGSIELDDASTPEWAASGIEESRVPADVRDAVEEYLRKFFNASLRLTDVLDEEVETYTRLELAPFLRRQNFEAEVSDALVELTAVALKRNPRRITQFVNNLSLRWEVLSQRRAADRIQIDPDVLVVAKLALIEEEWPDHFRAIRRRPEVLGGWQRELDSSDLLREENSVADRDFADFLRLSDHVDISDVRPYLTLKQSRAERTLPRYSEFTTLLRNGRAEELEEFLDLSPSPGQEPGARAYIEVIPGLFRELVRRRSFSQVLAVLRSSLETPHVKAADPSLAANLLEEALSHPELRSRLRDLPAEPLLDATQQLPSQARRNRVLASVVLAYADASPSARRSIGAALATRLDMLDEQQLSTLRGHFSIEVVRRDFVGIEPLVGVLPGLGPEVLRDAISALETSTFDDYRPPLSVATALIGPKLSETDALRFVSVIWNLLVARFAEPTAFSELADDAVRGIKKLPELTGSTPILEAFNASFPNVHQEAHPSALSFGFALLDASDEASANPWSNPLATRLFERPGIALDWLRKHPEAFRGYAGDAVRAHLSILLSGSVDTDTAKAAAELARGVPNAATLFESAVVAAVGSGRFDEASLLLRDDESALAERFEHALSEYVRAAQPAPGAAAILGLGRLRVSRIYTSPSATDLVIESIERQETAGRNAFDALAAQDDAAEFTAAVVQRLFQYVQGQSATISNALLAAGLAAEHLDHLDESERDRFVMVLIAAIENGSEVLAVAGILGRIAVVPAEDRLRYVQALIAAETRSDHEREAILTAACYLGGRANSRAAKAVDARLRQLASEDPDNEAMLARIRGS